MLKRIERHSYKGNNIVGTPFEVARDTQSRFVIRATNSFGKRDRTFSLTVIGPDNPNWVTPEGRLGVGPNNVLFILIIQEIKKIY